LFGCADSTQIAKIAETAASVNLFNIILQLYNWRLSLWISN